MLVSDVMRPDAAVISPLAMLEEAARTMQRLDIGFLPVCREGHCLGELLGVLTDRDIVLRAVATGRDGPFSRVADVMTTPAVICKDTDPVADAHAAMVAHAVRRLPVVNAQGQVTGIVTAARLDRTAINGGGRIAKPGKDTNTLNA